MKTLTKKITIALIAVLAFVCFCFGFYGLKSKTAEASTVETSMKVETYAGAKDGQAYVGAEVSLPLDTYRDAYDNRNVHTSFSFLTEEKHVDTVVLLARSKSIEEYYSVSLNQQHIETGNFNENYDLYEYIEEDEFPALLSADVVAFHKTASANFNISNVLDRAISGNFTAKSSHISMLFERFYTPEHVNYYYWVYVVKVSYIAGEKANITDSDLENLIALFNGKYYVSIAIEELAKSAPITYDNGTQGPHYSNPAELYQEFLDTNTSYGANKDKVRAFQKELGYYHEAPSNIAVEYKAFENGIYTNKTENYSVDSLYLTSESQVFNQISKLNGKNLASYNVVKSGDLKIVKGDGSTYTATSGDRILLQADGYEYTYDKYNNGRITIKYNDFQYKDLYLHVYHNDDDNKPLYTVDIYPVDVIYSSDNKYITLTYSKEMITKILLDTVEWLVAFESNTVEINNLPSFVTKTNLTKTIDGVEVDDGFSLTFPAERESELYTTSLSWRAKIKEDVDYSFKYTYITLSGLEVVRLSSATETKKYSELYGYHANDFLKNHESIIGGDNLKLSDGTVFAKLDGVDKVFNFENNTCVFEVKYLFKSIIKATNSKTDEFSLYVMTGNSLNRTAEDFNFKIPSGFRIESFNNVTKSFRIGEFNKRYPLKTQFVFDKTMWSEEFNVHEVKAIVTDIWPVSVDYLMQIKSQISGKGSCFAEMKTFKGGVKVSDYDMYNLTEDDVAKIILEGTGDSVEFIDFIKIPIKMSGVEVALKNTEEGDCYFISTGYTSTYIKGINSDGSYTYYDVGLTRFSDWQEYFGADSWNITALAPDVFKYSDAVDADKLYGFFQVMTFKEEFSDFNSWFKEYTASDGCVTFYQSKEVKGSDLYKFLSEKPSAGALIGGSVGLLFGHPIAGATAGTAVQIGAITLAEMLDDANGTYYSYFFYLDGTNDRNYASHNGATDYDDHDSAIENKAEKIGKKIFDLVLTAVLILISLAIIILLINLISKIESKGLKTVLYILLLVGVGIAIYFAYPVVLGVITAL